MEYDSVSPSFARLKSLRDWGNKNDRDVVTEIADLWQRLRINGFTDEYIEEATGPAVVVPAPPQKTLEELVDEAITARLDEAIGARLEQKTSLWKRLTQ